MYQAAFRPSRDPRAILVNSANLGANYAEGAKSSCLQTKNIEMSVHETSTIAAFLVTVLIRNQGLEVNESKSWRVDEVLRPSK